MKKIIFDVDGVLLSEEHYYDVSGLTVWEILYGRAYMGLPSEREDFVPAAVTDGQTAAIRQAVWGGDRLLAWLRGKGLNSNWDMVHAWLITAFWLMAEEYQRRTGGDVLPLSFRTESDFRRAGMELMGLPVPKADAVLARWEVSVSETAEGAAVIRALAEAMRPAFGEIPEWTAAGSDFSRMCAEAFQSWYLGDDGFIARNRRLPVSGGKKGFLRKEQLLAPAGEILALFRRLKAEGWELAVATGRSREETEIPFRQFGWQEGFDPLFIASGSDAWEASKKLGGVFLDKPHPFLYECAAYGRRPEAYREYAEGAVRPAAGDEIWVIGDSEADRLGSEAAGFRFLGILTGLEGTRAAEHFRRAGVPFAERVTAIEQIVG